MDQQEYFIKGKVQKYLKVCLKNPGWIHFSKAKCTPKYRAEIFRRVAEILTLMGVEFQQYENTYKFPVTYKLRVLRKRK